MRTWLSRFLLFLARLLLWPLKRGWRAFGWLGLKLRQGVVWGARLLWRRLGQPLWRLLGRLGLALRNLLTWIVRRPTLFFWQRFVLPIWAFIGRLGLAFRNILERGVWRPLLFVTAPLRFIYRRVLHRPLRFILSLLGRLLLWLLRQLARFLGWLLVRPLRAAGRALRARWQAGYPQRRQWKRQLYAHWRVVQARLRVLLRWQRPAPDTPIAPPVAHPDIAPHGRRATRLVTTALALGMVVMASVFTAEQTPGLKNAGAKNDYQLVSSKFTSKPTGTPAPVQPTATATPVPTATPWPTPDPLNSGGSVAFTLRQQGNSDIYALSIGQSQPVRLTAHPAGDRDPAWSPDGRQLAFASHRDGNWELYLLNLPDGKLQRLTDDPAFDAGPAWSPDGKWLVFESYRAGNLDIYILNLEEEQGPIRLTLDPAPDYSPVWSPDGRHIAFTSWRSGNKDLFILSLDAAADNQAQNVTGSPDRQEDHPAFSPDGSQLAYDDNSSGFELVHTLPLVDYGPASEPASRGRGRHPSWSPDGNALTYVHSKTGQNHLIAGSLDAWSVAPQAFTTDVLLDDPNWSARTLPHTLPEPLQAINEMAGEPLVTEVVYAPQTEGPPYLLQELAVNAPAPYLSDRVDLSFRALRRTVQERGGWDFLGQLAQMYEPLDAKPLPGQSDRTWNKAGRAFDYDTSYVLAIEPQVEVVREDGETGTYWRTYLRAAAQDGSQGEPLRDLPWDFRARYGPESQYYDRGGKLKEQIPAGYYLDFTQLAEDYGWERVATSDNWRTYFPGARFWHYERRQELNWEQAMLELYTVEELLSTFK